MKYLAVYKEWAKAKEQTPDMYLCNYFADDEHDDLLNLIRPTTNDEIDLWMDGCPVFAWGHGDVEKSYKDYKPYSPFTPLRRNLLLLMAAMNDEL